jgi:hypothetical protein
VGNLKDKMVSGRKRILAVGATGTGKSIQAWTLPGRKFEYVFDPNTMAALKGVSDQLGIEPPDIEAEEFYPDIINLDTTLKGFRTGSKGDKPEDVGRARKEVEPIVYMDFIADINRRVDEGFFSDFDWLIFDSLTFLSKAVMARNIDDFSKAEEFGIGAILTEHGWKPKGSSAPRGASRSKKK